MTSTEASSFGSTTHSRLLVEILLKVAVILMESLTRIVVLLGLAMSIFQLTELEELLELFDAFEDELLEGFEDEVLESFEDEALEGFEEELLVFMDDKVTSDNVEEALIVVTLDLIDEVVLEFTEEGTLKAIEDKATTEEFEEIKSVEELTKLAASPAPALIEDSAERFTLPDFESEEPPLPPQPTKNKARKKVLNQFMDMPLTSIM